jgi:hypothetical protein
MDWINTMPTITAEHNGTRAVGNNASERPIGDTEAPSVSISNNAPRTFFNHLETLHYHDRSAYACAEAQALSKLLATPEVNITRLSDIRFNTPNSHDGHLRWAPCDNCLSWLESSGGDGYRVKDTWDTVPIATPYAYNPLGFPSLSRT